MSLVINRPGPTERQVSGKDPEGRWLLSVLVKRTYTLSADGECRLAEEQPPLREAAQIDDGQAGLMIHDFELFHFKRGTDVIVKGHAQGYDRKPKQTEVAVQVGSKRKHILVLGNRKCVKSAAGKTVFSMPEAIEKIPLSYTHAYGGADVVAQTAAAPEFVEKYKEYEAEIVTAGLAAAFRYPRNPCGKGYLLQATPQALEALDLPNLEDPLARLIPDKLEVGYSVYWPRMPLPQATDWVAYTWFPRIAGLGIIPAFDGANVSFAEVSRGFLPEKAVQLAKPMDADGFLLMNGASPGLQVPYLRGGEAVSLTNIHPKAPAFSFKLPSRVPKICTDGRKGKFNETQTIMNSVVVEPDEGRVTISWRGSAPALRPYMPQELEKMPLRVEWA